MIKKIVKGFWVFFVLMVLVGIVVFVFIVYGWIGYMFFVEELENLNYKFVIEIFLEDGKVLGMWLFSKENCVYIFYNEFLFNIVNVLIVMEDVCFIEYLGIDVKVLICVVVKCGLLM